MNLSRKLVMGISLVSVVLFVIFYLVNSLLIELCHRHIIPCDEHTRVLINCGISSVATILLALYLESFLHMFYYIFKKPAIDAVIVIIGSVFTVALLRIYLLKKAASK